MYASMPAGGSLGLLLRYLPNMPTTKPASYSQRANVWLLTRFSSTCMQPPPVVLRLWKYRDVTSSARDGQQMGVWMNQLTAEAPRSASSALVCGIGPTPLCCGKLPPSFWSWSSVRKKMMLGVPALAGGAGGSGAGGGAGPGCGAMGFFEPQVEYPRHVGFVSPAGLRWQLPGWWFVGAAASHHSQDTHSDRLAQMAQHASALDTWCHSYALLVHDVFCATCMVHWGAAKSAE